MMKLSSIGATLAKKRVQIDSDDAVISHCVREVGTYVCDAMFQMGIRTYDPSIAKAIARQMLAVLGEKEERWSDYMKTDAPQINRQLKAIYTSTEP